MDDSIVKKLVGFLKPGSPPALQFESAKTLTRMLDLTGMLNSGDSLERQESMVEAGAVHALVEILISDSPHPSVASQAVRLLKSIFSDHFEFAPISNRVDGLIKSGAVHALVDVLAKDKDICSWKDLVAVLDNATNCLSSSQLALMRDGKLSQMFWRIHYLLEANETKIILKILDITTKILVAAEKQSKSELCNAVELLRAKRIVALLYHDDDEVYKKSFAILENYLWAKMRYVERILAVRDITLSEQEKGYYAREDCAEKMSFESIIEGSNCFLVLGVFI